MIFGGVTTGICKSASGAVSIAAPRICTVLERFKSSGENVKHQLKKCGYGFFFLFVL
jgi:hypothetical protein